MGTVSRLKLVRPYEAGGPIPHPDPFAQERVASLEQRMLSLELSLDRLAAAVDRVTNTELPRLLESISRLTDQLCGGEAIEIRELPREQAKQEILEYVRMKGRGSYTTIVEALNLDLQLVVELCEELVTEGKIEEVQ